MVKQKAYADEINTATKARVLPERAFAVAVTRRRVSTRGNVDARF